MVISRETIIRQLKILALFFGASVIQAYFMCGSCKTAFSYARVISFTFLMWTFLWQGNNALTHFISQRISWIDFPLKRFAIGLLATIGYSMAVTLVLIILFQQGFDFNFGGSLSSVITTAISLTILISLFLHSREFLFHWRKAALDAERYEREHVSAKYESLKNRVNPQLLYNSLQALRSLIPSNKERAIKFIKDLSDVYRYILDTRDKELVNIQEEEKFLRSFISLLDIRFQGSVKFSLDLDNRSFHVSPLALQLIIESLIENTSGDQVIRLDGKIIARDKSVDIHCTLHWRDDQSMNSLRTTLLDIEEKYRVLTDTRLVFSMDAQTFSCRIPALELDPSFNNRYQMS